MANFKNQEYRVAQDPTRSDEAIMKTLMRKSQKASKRRLKDFSLNEVKKCALQNKDQELEPGIEF